jgi:hypothetical protein
VNDRKSLIEYTRYILVGLFIILVVSSAVFIIYTLSLRRETAATTAAVQEPSHQTGGEPVHAETPAVPPPPDTAAHQPVRGTETAQAPLPPVRKLSRLYAVVIAAYPENGPAADEVSRWNAAGYIASVLKTKHHFLVTLGQYESVPEAKTFAEGMFEAFENGYWVGVIE